MSCPLDVVSVFVILIGVGIGVGIVIGVVLGIVVVAFFC